LGGKKGARIELLIDQVAQARPVFQSDRVKEFVLKSELLSKFHGREILMKASVILPPNYDGQPKRHWPVEYWIGGFGSGHRVHRRSVQRWDMAPRTEDIARVVLNPKCFGGHHVFADSANNGPRGKALVEEFIPALEGKFRFTPARTARFLSGHSSGGWSSLWLQVTYPETFGGTWSLAPDPVDFRNFQNPDIYRAKANMFTDKRGKPVALAQRNGRAFYYTKKFSDMEVVYGEGGQLRSFEWVFSPRGPDGLPLPLYDRKTGAIDPEVAEAWKKYDIGLVLQNNWKTLGPKLKGTIHVFCGDQDTFYLHPAVVRLKKTMKKLRSDAVIELHRGADHSTVATPKLKKRIREEMLAVYDKAHGKKKR
jgi:S-formylglutathione hydrolase FrmB